MIEWRDFRPEDKEGFDPNGMTLGTEIASFDAILNMFEIHTLLDDDKPVAFIAFYEYGERVYNAFIMASKDLKPSHGRAIKKALWDGIRLKKAIRVETTSLDTPELNRWHEFLGLKCDGYKKKYFAGRDYKSWSIVDGY